MFHLLCVSKADQNIIWGKSTQFLSVYSHIPVCDYPCVVYVFFPKGTKMRDLSYVPQGSAYEMFIQVMHFAYTFFAFGLSFYHINLMHLLE